MRSPDAQEGFFQTPVSVALFISKTRKKEVRRTRWEPRQTPLLSDTVLVPRHSSAACDALRAQVQRVLVGNQSMETSHSPPWE